MRGIGNMTNVEKLLNKEDLIAYKNYDNKQYSMIPGISKERAFMERSKAQTVPDSEIKDSPNRSSINKFYQ